MATRTIYNATTQADEEATLSVDKNNEIVATFENGSFIKFPAGLTQEEFDAAVEAVGNDDNRNQEIVTPETEAAQKAERAASLALIGETEDEESAPADEEKTDEEETPPAE